MLNRCIYKKRKKTELTNYTSITQVDITMKNDESKHTNGTLIKLLLKRTPPPHPTKKKIKLVSILHVQSPGNTTYISSGHFPLSLISNVQFSGGSRGGVRGAWPPLLYRPNWGLKSQKKIFGDLSEGRDPPDGVQ